MAMCLFEYRDSLKLFELSVTDICFFIFPKIIAAQVAREIIISTIIPILYNYEVDLLDEE